MGLPVFLVSVIFLCGCTNSAYINRNYDFHRIQRIGILEFNSRFEDVAGTGSIFAKYMLKNGFNVVDRGNVEDILREQNLSASGAVTAKTAKEIGKLLGVDALLAGEVTEYKPERKEIIKVRVKTKYVEPVFQTVWEMQKDGTSKETKMQIGTNVRFEESEVPQFFTTDAKVGIAAKLIDVETGEICWAGSDINESVNAQIALDTTVYYLVRQLKKQIGAVTGQKL